MSGQHDLVQFGGPGWALDKAVQAIASVRHAIKGIQLSNSAQTLHASQHHSQMQVVWW